MDGDRPSLCIPSATKQKLSAVEAARRTETYRKEILEETGLTRFNVSKQKPRTPQMLHR